MTTLFPSTFPMSSQSLSVLKDYNPFSELEVSEGEINHEEFDKASREKQTEMLRNTHACRFVKETYGSTSGAILGIDVFKYLKRLSNKGYWSPTKQIEYCAALQFVTDPEEGSIAATKDVKKTFKLYTEWEKEGDPNNELDVLMTPPLALFFDRRGWVTNQEDTPATKAVHKAFINSSPDMTLMRSINNQLKIIDHKILQDWDRLNETFALLGSEEAQPNLMLTTLFFCSGDPVDFAYARFLNAVNDDLKSDNSKVTTELALDFAAIAASWFKDTGAVLALLSTLAEQNPSLKFAEPFSIQQRMLKFLEDNPPCFKYLSQNTIKELLSSDGLATVRDFFETFVLSQDRDEIIELIEQLPTQDRPFWTLETYAESHGWVDILLREADPETRTFIHAVISAYSRMGDAPTPEEMRAAADSLGLSELVDPLARIMLTVTRARNEVPLAEFEIGHLLADSGNSVEAFDPTVILAYEHYKNALKEDQTALEEAAADHDYAKCAELSQSLAEREDNPPPPVFDSLKTLLPSEELADQVEKLLEKWIIKLTPASKTEARDEALFDEMSAELDEQRDTIAKLESKVETLQSELELAEGNLKAVGSVTVEPTQREALLAPEVVSLLLKDDLTLSDTLTIVQQAYPKVVILKSAYDAAENSPFAYPKRVLTHLIALAGPFRDALAKGNPSKEAAGIAGLNGSYRPQESDTVMKDDRLRSQREFMYQSSKTVFKQHLSIGTAHDTKETCQIHFLLDEGTLVIGRLGTHLDTARSK